MPHISVFTPSNSPRWLAETYDSLAKQTFSDFEWVLVLNGGLKHDDVPEVAVRDLRTRVIATEADGVGALKRFACGECKGEILVELDHDDKLTPDALQVIADAHAKEPTGFYYSDFVSVFPDGRSELYRSDHGWETYQWRDSAGDEYTAQRAFEPSARSICEIFYAPNHVRAWSRNAYDAAGGHDPSMKVGDDHDMVCRTYLAGTPFVHLPHVLYVYRSHPESTCRTDNAKVQAQQKANQARYLYPLVYEECRRRGLDMYDLGHTDVTRQGFKPLTLFTDYINIYLLNDLKPNSVGCMWASDVLQRVDPKYLGGFFNLAYKALAPGGWLMCQSPSIDDGEGKAGRGAFQDPGHISYWSANSFWYFTHRDYAKYVNNYTSRFQLARCWSDYPTAWHKSNYIPYVHADMYALKGQRAAGLCTI